MLKYIPFGTLLCVFLAIGCMVKHEQESTSALNLDWKIVEDNYNGTRETRSLLTIKNNSSDTLLNDNWTIYFNTGGATIADADTNLVKIELVNGDFFKLYPQSDWKALAPNDSVQVSVLTRKLSNNTDVAKGFYLVSESYPDGVSLPFVLEHYSKADSTEMEIANKNYVLNEGIQEINLTDLPPVIPTPVSYEYTSDTFELGSNTAIVVDPGFEGEAEFLQEELAKVLTSSPKIVKEKQDNAIVLKKAAIDNKEGYELEVSNAGIEIQASTPAGIFYGIQSLKNLLPTNAWKEKQSAISLKGVKIADAPRFGHRAVMLDVSRNFQTKEQVLKVLDLLALYKVNIMHFHITEDEAWRLEIPGLPELTEVGSRRGHTTDELENLMPSYGSGPDALNKTGSGFYSKADFIEILKYATKRHIQVLPEIETPGHARAAIQSMQKRYVKYMNEGDSVAAKQYLLRDLNDQSVYRSIQNWNDNIIDVALPSTYTFLEKVTDELIKMYKEANAPLASIHFGGDEVPNGVWEKSPAYLSLKASDSSIKSADDLWYYYFDKINKMLKARNLYLSGWEEIGMKMVEIDGNRRMVVEPRFAHENFHVDVWNNLGDNEDLAYRLANAGYKVVLTNVTNFYIDLAYNHSFYEIGQYWGGYVDLDKPFRFIPYNYYKNQTDYRTGNPVNIDRYANRVRLNDNAKGNIVGIQAPLWAEIINSPERMEYLLLPKLFAVAERAWAVDPDWAVEPDEAKAHEKYAHAWSVFVNEVGKRELPRMDYYGGGFNYRIPTVGVAEKEGNLYANIQLPGMTIRYTTDGSEPTADSPVYGNPVPASGKVSFRAFNTEGRGGRTVSFTAQ